MFYNRKWFIPLVMGLILIGLWFTRWETTATKTQDYGVIKWKRDRWSNTNYVDYYIGPNTGDVTPGFYELPETPYQLTTNATATWAILFIADMAWLAWAYRKESSDYEE